MQQNVTFSSGNISLIDKIDSETDFFESVLGNIDSRSRSFIPAVKLLISNKLNQSVSINKVLDFTPDDLLKLFGFEDRISERSLYRVLERVGENQPVIIERFQHWIKQQKLVDSIQFMDFSTSYFEGSHCPLGKRGYSWDNQPGKLQFTSGQPAY
jgi:transposase